MVNPRDPVGNAEEEEEEDHGIFAANLTQNPYVTCPLQTAEEEEEKRMTKYTSSTQPHLATRCEATGAAVEKRSTPGEAVNTWRSSQHLEKAEGFIREARLHV